MILEVVNNYVRPKDSVRHGQVVWAAVDKDHRPGRYQRIAETDLVSVVLDMSTAEDIHARIDRVPDYERRLNRALRLCRQAYEQGGLLTCCDLSEIMGLSDSAIAQLLACYERQNKTLVPRRGTLHDAGGGLSHKGIICYKRYVEGKSPEQIAQETYCTCQSPMGPPRPPPYPLVSQTLTSRDREAGILPLSDRIMPRESASVALRNVGGVTMADNIEILNTAVSLLVRAALLAARSSRRVRQQSLKLPTTIDLSA